MNTAARLASRRRVLKGMLGGTAVTVGLPLLEGFLNTNGTALAATGAPLPVRFGTWFWGCGMAPGQWEPARTGPDYELPKHLKMLSPFRDKLSIFSGMNVNLGSNGLVPHTSGQRGCSAGDTAKVLEKPTIDVVVADAIGNGTRFRSLEVSAMGNATHTVSRRNASILNPSEGSPAALYTRIFGPEFRDPNAADFKPDPRMMVRKSVLSAVKEPRGSLTKLLGTADRARLDQYFTSLRQLEQQVELQLEKPAPLEACVLPKAIDKANVGTDVDVAHTTHKLMAGLLAHAMACDQTRVINVSYTDPLSSLRKAGESASHHIQTHEEPIDPKLGYQEKVYWYEERIMDSLADLLKAMDDIKEGDGTLLDHSLLFAFSECGLAKAHSLVNIPMFLAGKAGGRVKSGVHVAAKGDPTTRVGLTIQQLMGLPLDQWGTGVMQTSKAITEIVA